MGIVLAKVKCMFRIIRVAIKRIMILLMIIGASLVAQSVKNLPAKQETVVWFLDQEEPLEKEMATHCSIRACRIPWTEKPGRLQSMQSQNTSMYASNRAFGAAVTKSGHKAAAFLQRPVLFMFFSSFCAFIVIFYWSRVDFWNCVSFRCTGTLFSDLRCLTLLSLGSCSIYVMTVCIPCTLQ